MYCLNFTACDTSQWAMYICTAGAIVCFCGYVLECGGAYL